MDEASTQYADLLFQMSLLNSGFIVDEPTDLTSPLEKLIRVGFGIQRDEPIVEIEIEIEEEPEVDESEPVFEDEEDEEEHDEL